MIYSTQDAITIDTLFGECAFLFPHVKLKLCLPIKGYRGHALDELKERANDIFWISEVWDKGLNTKRSIGYG